MNIFSSDGIHYTEAEVPRTTFMARYSSWRRMIGDDDDDDDVGRC
jgi:hypothetical protein